MVKKIDCCKDISAKATIIINDNTVSVGAGTATSTANASFNFELTSSVNTSAGVYNKDDNLVRTLWGGVRYDAGCYLGQWDGLLDDGSQAPYGNYTVKVLTNNVQYTWEGVVGNSSDSFTGDHIYTGFSGPFAFAFSGIKGYLGDRFAEGGNTATNFQLSDAGNPSLVTGGLSIVNTAMATDGTNIYYAGYDDYQGLRNLPRLNLIYATKISDGSRVDFSAGNRYGVGRNNTSASVIGTYTGGNSNTNAGNYSGLTVNSKYIFAATAANNTLYVIDKISGSTVQTLTFTKPGSLACTKDGTKLWVAFPSSVKLYTINTDGTLADTGTSVAASSNVSIACSPTVNELAVADSATNQVKFYSSLLGSYNSTFGQAGGYNNSPLVTYDKFQFLDKKHFIYAPRIAYLPDGGFALNDAGNYRLLIFNTDRTYRDQVAFVRSSRSTNADPNNPNKVFADVLEYQVDYSKTLDNGTNGSWKLKYNWNVSDRLNIYGQFEQVVTLSNGHTYAIGSNQLFDLRTDVGAVFLSGFDGGKRLQADGSLYERQWDNYKGATIIKYLPAGFDSNFMPQWNSGSVIAASGDRGNDNPAYYVNNTIGAGTNSNYYFFFNPNHDQNFIESVLGNSYHLGGVKTGGKTYNWLASKSTYSRYHSADGLDYSGDYPRNGDFDIGNNDYAQQHSENCTLLVNGSDLFWHVNAEFWQTNGGANNGVNIWNHFNEDGLFIGNFGVTGTEAKVFFNNAGNAGNSYSTALVKVGNDYYIYHCDESQHGGIHRWHVTGLNTITEIAIPIVLTAPIPAYNDPTDLMAGLPYKSTNFAGNAIWSFTPATSTGGFNAQTSTKTYRKDAVDILLKNNTQSDGVALATLPITNSNNWSFTGKFAFPNYLSDGEIGNTKYIQLLDINDKVLINITIKDVGSYFDKVQFNDKVLFSGYNYDLTVGTIFNQLTPFYVKNTNGQITVGYSGYTAIVSSSWQTGANFTAPSKIKIKEGGYGSSINISELRFY